MQVNRRTTERTNERSIERPLFTAQEVVQKIVVFPILLIAFAAQCEQQLLLAFLIFGTCMAHFRYPFRPIFMLTRPHKWANTPSEKNPKKSNRPILRRAPIFAHFALSAPGKIVQIG